MTIVEAIKYVLADYPDGLSSTEIYEKIIDGGLYSFKAMNPVSVVNGTIRRHCQGLSFPSSSPVKHFSITAVIGKTPRYGIATKEVSIVTANKSEMDHEILLPEEVMQKEYEKHLSSIREMLKQAIFENDPQFFEQLVVDLLIAMGYGYDKTSGIVVGGSHDGGIDGIIYEDKLGLDQIYLQAKRFKEENRIGRKELQAFVGAMQSVQKGVFITTSSFTKEAVEYADKQQQKSLKLVDGNMLADLMIKYEIGIIKAAKPFVIYKLDSFYFS